MNLLAIRDAVRILNEALEADPEAVNRLFNHRVRVNEALTLHPTIQVASLSVKDARPEDTSEVRVSTLGVLGLINGLFGVDVDGWGYIVSVNDDNDRILRFEDRTGHANTP